MPEWRNLFRRGQREEQQEGQALPRSAMQGNQGLNPQQAAAEAARNAFASRGQLEAEEMRTGQRQAMPTGGAPGMPAMPGAQGMPRGRAPMAGEADAPRAQRAVRNAEAEAAFQRGARMGAESLNRDAGREPFRLGGGTETERMAGMTKERIQEATLQLMRYKTGKHSVDQRVIRAQQWWRLRNWEMIQAEKGVKGAKIRKSATAWLWNCIVGKHADAIDSYPEPVILPRAADDQEEAKRLSEVIPVVMEMNDFEETYNDCQWQKMQEGTAVYGVFWDKTKMNGMGDIAIRKINILNLFWEPGVTDIQESRNLFYVYLMDNDELEDKYPQLKGKLNGNNLVTAKYRTDDNIPTDNKSAVVDWYYHTWNNGKKELQLCKFCSDEILYSTENEGISLYNDGDYPFVMDPLFPVEGSPAGYGYIDIGKDAQGDIDTLNQAMVLNATVSATPRHFVRKDGGVNEEEFADWSKPLVHVNGNMGEDSIKAIQTTGMNGICLDMLQQKIDELKFITGNTDINNGGVPSGVTAASAIAALKEDSGRSSKDSTKAAYRSYRKIVNMVIERIRQFYDIQRQFRIIGRDGQEEFITYSNAKIREQPLSGGLGLENATRLPVFDIEVRAQRENAYTKMSQNELAIQFLQLGMFSPNLTDQAMMALDMMDFKGKDEIRQKIEEQGTMQDTLMKVAQIAMSLAQQYNPAIAQQLATVMQGITGDMGLLPAATGAGSLEGATKAQEATRKASDANENGIVKRARERAEAASRPD